MIELLRSDMVAARSAWIGADPANDSGSDFLRYQDSAGRYADFHSLRHTCGSWLAVAGVHPKVIQTVMRHSTIALTLDNYTHPFKADIAAAVSKLPDLSRSGIQCARATGTDSESARSRGALRGAPGGKSWTEVTGRVDSSPDDADEERLDDGRKSFIDKAKANNRESAGERTRTSTGVTPPEPKSGASANSATPAEPGVRVMRDASWSGSRSACRPLKCP